MKRLNNSYVIDVRPNYIKIIKHFSNKYIQSNIDELIESLFNSNLEPHAHSIGQYLHRVETIFLRLKNLPINCLCQDTIQLKISGYNSILCDLKYLVNFCSNIYKNNYEEIEHLNIIQEISKQILKIFAQVTYELEKILRIQHKFLKKQHVSNTYTSDTIIDFFCNNLHRILNEVRQNQPCSIESLFAALKQRIALLYL